MENTPVFVCRDGMLSNTKYVEWLSDVKKRLRKSQIKTTIQVNTSMLEFYWSIGRDLVALRAEERWGTGVVKQFAIDMRHSFPDITGFSYSNVKYMKQWYLFYYKNIMKGQQLVGQIETSEKCQQLVDILGKTEKSHQPGGQIELTENGKVHS